MLSLRLIRSRLRDLGDDQGADLVVADEGDVARALRARLGLAQVVEERAETHRLPRVSSSASGSARKAVDLGREVAREPLHVALEAEPLPQHLQRVAEDVEVVVRVLDDTAERLQLGKHRSRQIELVHQLDAPHGPGPGDDPAKLRELALPGRLGGVGRGALVPAPPSPDRWRGRTGTRAGRRAAAGSGRPGKPDRRRRAAGGPRRRRPRRPGRSGPHPRVGARPH